MKSDYNLIRQMLPYSDHTYSLIFRKPVVLHSLQLRLKLRNSAVSHIGRRCAHRLVEWLNARVNHHWAAIPGSLSGCRKMIQKWMKTQLGIHRGSRSTWNSQKWRYTHGVKGLCYNNNVIFVVIYGEIKIVNIPLPTFCATTHTTEVINSSHGNDAT